MITCQICGHQNPEGVEYCEDCGAALVPSSAPPPAAAASAPPAAPADQAPAGTAAPGPVGLPAAEPPAAAPGGPAADTAAPVVPATPAPAVAATPSAPAAGQKARLVARRYGAASGEEYPLLGDRLILGRFDPETGPVDIDLSQIPEAPQLSRHHAELYREADGHWHVKDLGSTNGVFIKSAGSAAFGPRLTAPQALANGDEVAFGNARFIFRTD
jgi:hypothetical protein